MARFKAGDRVKILAGHPYWLGEHRNSVGEEGEGVYIGRAGKRHRGKHLVEVTYDDGRAAELSFKGRELELLPEAEAWVPKVGDRVRVTNPSCMRTGTPVGAEGVVTRAGGGEYFDIDLTHPTDGVISQYVNADNVEPLPVAEQPAGLVVEAGKFYRTRDGRKVGPILAYPHSGYFHVAAGTVAGNQLWDVDGTALQDERKNDLIAEWDEPESPIIAVTTPEPAAEPAKFKVGDRVAFVEDYDGRVKAGDLGVVAGFWEADGRPDGGVKVEHSSGLRHCYAHRLVLATPTNFIVARLTPSGQPRPNARPRVHATLASAEDEAQRLADRLGDEFAVYQRVAVREVDAGPVPPYFLASHAKSGNVSKAFLWNETDQGYTFWRLQSEELTPLGRAILRKWIAEVEANATTKEAA